MIFPLLRTPLSSGFCKLKQVHSSSYLSSFVNNMLFSLATFKVFLFITNFPQFPYSVLCIVFLVDYCASWDLLSFLDFF